MGSTPQAFAPANTLFPKCCYSGQENGDPFPPRAKNTSPLGSFSPARRKDASRPHYAMLARRGDVWKHKWSFISQRRASPIGGELESSTLHEWGGAIPAHVRRRGRFFRSGRTPETVTTREWKRTRCADVASCRSCEVGVRVGINP